MHSLHNAESFAVEDVLEAFHIQTRDRFENELDIALEAKNEYVVWLDGTAHMHSRQVLAGKRVIVPARVSTVVPNTDGVYRVEYDPEVAGNYTLSVTLVRWGGLHATYFQNPDLTVPFPGRLPHCLPTNEVCESTRIDSTVNFAWGVHSALSAPYVYPADFFSVRWTGFVLPPVTDKYRFYVVVDGGVRLWIGDDLVLDSWTPSVSEPYTEELLLAGGVKYAIRMEYMDDTDSATVRLMWSSASGSVAKQIVPSTALYNSRHLRGSPMLVTFSPGAIDATTTTAAGDGLIGGVAGDPFVLTVNSWDTHSNQRFMTGLDTYDITVTAVDGWAAMNRVNDAWTGVPIVFSTFTGTVGAVPQDWTRICQRCASTFTGSTIVQTATDLTTSVRRGQRVSINGETFMVHLTASFTATQLPLQAPVMSASSTSAVDVYRVDDGDATASHVVTYNPTIRGNYSVDVRIPRTTEVQSITLTGLSAIGGTFAVKYGALSTPALAYNIDHVAMQGHLTTLLATPFNTTVSVNVTVSAADSFGGRTWMSR